MFTVMQHAYIFTWCLYLTGKLGYVFSFVLICCSEAGLALAKLWGAKYSLGSTCLDKQLHAFKSTLYLSHVHVDKLPQGISNDTLNAIIQFTLLTKYQGISTHGWLG